MGVHYHLVNPTKREWIAYAHLPVGKPRELAGNPASAAITTWYMLQNPGDAIAFVSDTYDDWPFPTGTRSDLDRYEEVTDRVVADLVRHGILRDEGKAWADEDDPEHVYIRALRNVWMEDA